MAEIDERYKRGKIYTIRCRDDDGLVYVGSTIQPLAKRIGGHRVKSIQKPNILLYKYVNNDWSNWYIELYEDYPCDNKEQLEKREGEVIRQIGNLNCEIAGRDKKQYYQDNRDKILEEQKKYHEDNRDKILERFKQYHKDNSDKRSKQNKQYRQDNRDKILEKDKQRYRDNIDMIKQRREQKCKCDICGAEITKVYLKKHQKTAKCMSANK
jgi:hypothetical protein